MNKKSSKKNRLILTQLRLQNFATFIQEEVSFSPDFNVIVGETGSGKSLILDALELIFGARADKKSIRKGAEFASIEAVFKSDDPDIKQHLNDIGHPFEGSEITVKRVIYPQESSKAFLNFQSCPLSTLSHFSKRYIDLVGQFENQKLLSEDYQLVLLDNFSKNQSLFQKYQTAFQELTNFQREKTKLEGLSHDINQKEDFLKFQIDEIESLSPSVEGEKKLLEKKEFISNWHKQQTTAKHVLNLLSENDEFNILSSLHSVIKTAGSIPQVDGLSHESLESAKVLIEDYCYELSRSLETEFDENEYEEIIDQLDRYQKLKRKFGGETQKVLETYAQYKKELSEIQKVDQKLNEVNQKITETKSLCFDLANQLHKKRLETSKDLSKKLTASIRSLKMVGASISFDIQKRETLDPRGCSEISLVAETNPGEGFHKVKHIASGGELSRILLGLRQILSSHDSISVFLFDEIDTGVGGETALAVGSALENVSLEGQVIAITHLPQIAKFANRIVEVTKDVNVKNKKTISRTQIIQDDKVQSYTQAMAHI